MTYSEYLFWKYLLIGRLCEMGVSNYISFELYEAIDGGITIVLDVGVLGRTFRTSVWATRNELLGANSSIGLMTYVLEEQIYYIKKRVGWLK